MIYDLAPGVLIETDGDDPAGGRHVLTEKQLEQAREKYEKRPTKKNLAEIASKLHAHVYEPEPEPASAPQIAVDLAGLRDALGDDKVAELTGVPIEILDQLQNRPQG